MLAVSPSEDPEWLYFVAWPPHSDGLRPGGGVVAHDWVPELARADADTLRLHAVPSGEVDDREAWQVGVIARSAGRPRSLYHDPTAPANRAALVRFLEGRDRGGYLSFIPGWMLDAFLRPRSAALPSDGVTHVVVDHGQDVWAHIKRIAYHDLPRDGQLQVLVIAGSELAPRIIRPGVVLEAYVLSRNTHGRVVLTGGAAATLFEQAYRGRVLTEVPSAISGRALPGQAVEELVQVEPRAVVDDLPYARSQQRGGAPEFFVYGEPLDAPPHPLFADGEAEVQFRSRHRGELVVREETDRDGYLGDEQLRVKSSSASAAGAVGDPSRVDG